MAGLDIKPPMLSHWWMPKFFNFCMHCVMCVLQKAVSWKSKGPPCENRCSFQSHLWFPCTKCHSDIARLAISSQEEMDSHYGLIHRGIIVSSVICSKSSTKLISKTWAVLKKQDVKLLCLKAIVFYFLSCLWFLRYHDSAKRKNIQYNIQRIF